MVYKVIVFLHGIVSRTKIGRGVFIRQVIKGAYKAAIIAISIRNKHRNFDLYS